MIICFNEKINSFDKNNLKNFKSYTDRNSYVQSLMPNIKSINLNKCPCCHAKNKLIKYGTYERNLSVLIGNNIENYKLTVQRVQCKSCNHTHALLPNFIIPYKIMALFSITEIVKKACISSVYKVSEKINLSFQLIYAFIIMVLAFFDDFKILNNEKNYIKHENFNKKYFLTNCVELSSSKYRLDFFEFYNWILFMQKFRNNSSPPITISISKVPPT